LSWLRPAFPTGIRRGIRRDERRQRARCLDEVRVLRAIENYAGLAERAVDMNLD
jgi:hypothetical protein